MSEQMTAHRVLSEMDSELVASDGRIHWHEQVNVLKGMGKNGEACDVALSAVPIQLLSVGLEEREKDEREYEHKEQRDDPEPEEPVAARTQ